MSLGAPTNKVLSAQLFLAGHWNRPHAAAQAKANEAIPAPEETEDDDDSA